MSPATTVTLWMERHTRFSGLLVLGLVLSATLLLWRPHDSMTNDTGSLSYPAQSGARLAERHLAFYEGFDAIPGWQQAFFAFLFDERTDVVNDAILTYEDILRFFAEKP